MARFEILNFLQERRHARVTFDDDVLQALADAELPDEAREDRCQPELFFETASARRLVVLAG